jgi:hypothetical protein
MVWPFENVHDCRNSGPKDPGAVPVQSVEHPGAADACAAMLVLSVDESLAGRLRK